MAGTTRVTPLVRSRTLWIGLSLFTGGALVAMYGGGLGRWLGFDPLWLRIASALIAGIAIFTVGAKLRCPGCRLKLLWHAMSRVEHDAWLPWLLKETHCPKCGYSRDRES